MIRTIPTSSKLLSSRSPPSCSLFSSLSSPHPPLQFAHRYSSTLRLSSSGGRRRMICCCSTDDGALMIKSKKKSRAFDIENLTSWLLRQERAGNLDGELTIVLSSISLACKQIASLRQRASISNLMGSQGTINVQGENQRKLDVISNEVFCNCLRSSGRTGIIASEEEEVPIAVEETFSGNYIVVFDPIDGSANIDTALTTGSIFGIYSSNDHCLVEEDDNGGDQSTKSTSTAAVKRNETEVHRQCLSTW